MAQSKSESYLDELIDWIFQICNIHSPQMNYDSLNVKCPMNASMLWEMLTVWVFVAYWEKVSGGTQSRTRHIIMYHHRCTDWCCYIRTIHAISGMSKLHSVLERTFFNTYILFKNQITKYQSQSRILRIEWCVTSWIISLIYFELISWLKSNSICRAMKH